VACDQSLNIARCFFHFRFNRDQNVQLLSKFKSLACDPSLNIAISLFVLGLIKDKKCMIIVGIHARILL